MYRVPSFHVILQYRGHIPIDPITLPLYDPDIHHKMSLKTSDQEGDALLASLVFTANNTVLGSFPIAVNPTP